MLVARVQVRNDEALISGWGNGKRRMHFREVSDVDLLRGNQLKVGMKEELVDGSWPD